MTEKSKALLHYWAIQWLASGRSIKETYSLLSRKIDGDLGDELKLTLRAHFLGLTLSESLLELSNRQTDFFVRIFCETLAEGLNSGWSPRITAQALTRIPSNPAVLQQPDSAEPEAITREKTIQDVRPFLKEVMQTGLGILIYGMDTVARQTIEAELKSSTGSILSVEAGSTRTACGTLQHQLAREYAQLPASVHAERIRQQYPILIHAESDSTQQIRIDRVSELYSGNTEDEFLIQDLLVFKETGVDKDDRIVGEYRSRGFIPDFVEALERRGATISRHAFFEWL